MDRYKEELIENAAALFTRLGLTSLKIRDEAVQFSIEMHKEVTVQQVTALPQGSVPAVDPATAIPEVPKAPEPDLGLDAIKAPLVGVFYAAPTPDQPAYVKVGDRVKKGDVLCIIEAMKMMNEIVADSDCVIEEVCAVNGKLVEFDQMLFKVRK